MATWLVHRATHLLRYGPGAGKLRGMQVIRHVVGWLVALSLPVGGHRPQPVRRSEVPKHDGCALTPREITQILLTAQQSAADRSDSEGNRASVDTLRGYLRARECLGSFRIGSFM